MSFVFLGKQKLLRLLKVQMNRNGTSYQLEIDTDKKTFEHGYFIFTHSDITGLSQKQINKIIDILYHDQFKIIN